MDNPFKHTKTLSDTQTYLHKNANKYIDDITYQKQTLTDFNTSNHKYNPTKNTQTTTNKHTHTIAQKTMCTLGTIL